VVSFGFWHTAFGATNEMGKVQSETAVTSSDITNILDKIEMTNVQIQDLIDKALVKTSGITIQLANETSILEDQKLNANPVDIGKINAEIKNFNQEANDQIAIIMNQLIEETDKIAKDMTIEAATYGIIVINEYVPYKINGIVYLVDPLRVVGE
jgi:ribosomal protein L18E